MYTTITLSSCFPDSDYSLTLTIPSIPTGNLLTQIFEFLDLPVPEDGSTTWDQMEALGPRVTYTQEVGWVIPEGARRVLSKLYEGHNADLAELLGDRSYLLWNEDAIICPPSC